MDYGAFSFLSSTPTTANVGRDYGILARGYLVNDRLEYRAGVFEGRRGEGASNAFRYVGRVMWNFFEPQKGLFYVGTSLGKKKLLSVGASYDTQDDYDAYTFDGFWDQPLSGGNGATVQAAYSHLDGDDFLTSLPEQDNIFAEAGFYHAGTKLMPFLQYSNQDFDDGALNDVEKMQDIVQEAADSTDPASDGGPTVTPSEREGVHSLPRPAGILPEHVDDLINRLERWAEVGPTPEEQRRVAEAVKGMSVLSA